MVQGATEKLIVRMLLDRELSGYDLHKEMTSKGVKIRSNYVYMVLASMHGRGLLKGRWLEGAGGPRRHLYSLSREGKEEFMLLVQESVNLIMDAFVHANLGAQDLPDHSDSVRGMFERLGVPFPRCGARFIVSVPAFDPLMCYPIAFRVLGETFPDASVWVIKPPSVKIPSDGANLTFLDGWRHDMPVKDGFADYLMLEGFPKEASEEDEVSECLRVLKNDAHLIIRHPAVMTAERRPKFTTFGEFASRLFYDFSEQDRLISVERVKELLSSRCREIRDAENRGNVVIYGSGKIEPQSAARIGETRSD